MAERGFLGGGFLSAFLKLLLDEITLLLDELRTFVSLKGDPIVEKVIGATSGAGGLAFDGTYFYLNNSTANEIYVYTPAGALVNTLSVARAYHDIEYDPFLDGLLAVHGSLIGIDVLSKADGSKIQNLSVGALAGQEFIAVAMDRYNNRLYLMDNLGWFIHVVTTGDFTLVKGIHLPAIAYGGTFLALDGEDRTKLWAGFVTFPPMMGRIDGYKVDKYRVLGTSLRDKRNISVRIVNNKWYHWGDMVEEAGVIKGRLYELEGLPVPTVVYVPPAAPAFDQDIYRWYSDDVAENPTPKAAENTGVTGVWVEDILRMRLGLEETVGSTIPWSGLIQLQYALSPTGPWLDVGAIGATDKAWRLYNGKGTDKAQVANLLLSTTTVKQYFVESYPPSAGLAFRKPNRGEFDICLQAFNPQNLQDYYFKAKVYDGLIKTYPVYPHAKAAYMPWERFIAWTEADPFGVLSQETFKSIFTNLNMTHGSTWLQNDYGAGHFTDFEHLLDVIITALASPLTTHRRMCFITYANALRDWLDNKGANATQLSILMNTINKSGKYKMMWIETYLGAEYLQNSTYEFSVGTMYYPKLTKSGASATLRIYSDSDRTNLLDTLNLTLQADHSFRYIMCPQSTDYTGAYDQSGRCENLNLQE